MEFQTFLIEGAMISLDKAMLLWVMGIADEHADSQAVTQAHQGGGKVTTLGRSHPACVPVQSDRGRETVFNECLCHSSQSCLGCKIGAHMVS